jgi:hypothetical protein
VRAEWDRREVVFLHSVRSVRHTDSQPFWRGPTQHRFQRIVSLFTYCYNNSSSPLLLSASQLVQRLFAQSGFVASCRREFKVRRCPSSANDWWAPLGLCRRVSWKCWAQDGRPSIRRLVIVIDDNIQMSQQMNTHGTDNARSSGRKLPLDRPDRLSAGSTPKQAHLALCTRI